MKNQLQWMPTASKKNLLRRAEILQNIRHFFQQRDVLEVETPFLSHHTVTNPYIHSLSCPYPANDKQTFYLQTSPEYHMKRLLSAEMGSIFQICKSFRLDEQGRLHNPEFTMMEWYRIGFTHHDLMDEMDVLLQTILHCEQAERYTYQAIFEKHLQLDPLTATVEQLRNYAEQNNLNDPGLEDNVDDWLMLLFSHFIEPHLTNVTFVYSFPASQATLSRINKDDPRVCDRFEVYARGMELANGFYELANATEQRERFEAEVIERQQLGNAALDIDENFIAALEHGLPDCAGVALGIDRLLMIAMDADSIEDVITFPFARA
jgi:lysyl-tRNA synthetase class 2